MLGQLKELQSVGYESMAILVNKTNMDAYRLGSDNGQMFMKKNEQIGVDFVTFLGGKQI